MPAKSGPQYRFMQAIAHGARPKGSREGPSQEVAQEFVDKTPAGKRKRFAKSLKKVSDRDSDYA